MWDLGIAGCVIVIVTFVFFSLGQDRLVIAAQFLASPPCCLPLGVRGLQQAMWKDGLVGEAGARRLVEAAPADAPAVRWSLTLSAVVRALDVTTADIENRHARCRNSLRDNSSSTLMCAEYVAAEIRAVRALTCPSVGSVGVIGVGIGTAALEFRTCVIGFAESGVSV